MTDQDLVDGNLLWAQGLTPQQLARVRTTTFERWYRAGSVIFRCGEPIAHWAGIKDGLLRLSHETRAGKTITFPSLVTGDWFGEDALLCDAPCRYDVVALQASRLVFVARATFTWLLDESVPFNRFVMQEISARLSHFADRIEIDQLRDAETSIARCLVALFSGPGAELCAHGLRISQAELGRLAGTSRQRTNRAIQRWKRERLLVIDNGWIKPLDLDRLRAYGSGEGLPASR